MNSNIITVKGISKSYGNKTVLHDTSFNIAAGEIFGIIGMSGAGKTTLLQNLMGVLLPDTGDIIFRPEHMAKLKKPMKVINIHDHSEVTKILFGYASQEPSFYPELTVVENLRYYGTLYDLEDHVLKRNVDTVIQLVALSSDRYTIARNLSGGMEKRLDIACALVHDPNVLILDEPTSDLDPVLRGQIWNLIKKINSIGTTVIIASHFIEELEENCDRIAILYNKKIVETDTPYKLRKKLMQTEHIVLESSPGNYKKLAHEIKRLKVQSIEARGHQLWVNVKKAEPYLNQVISICEKMEEKVLDIGIKKATLKEVFDRLIENEKGYTDYSEKL